MRLGQDGILALTLAGALAPKRARRGRTRSRRSGRDLVDASLAFGRALVRALLRRDRSQSSNLRLSAFRRSLRETERAPPRGVPEDAKVEPTARAVPGVRRAAREVTTARGRPARVDARRHEAPLLRPLARARPRHRPPCRRSSAATASSSAAVARRSASTARPGRSSGARRPSGHQRRHARRPRAHRADGELLAVHDFGTRRGHAPLVARAARGRPCGGRRRQRAGPPAPAHRDRGRAPPRRDRSHQRRAALAPRLGRGVETPSA